MKDNLAKLSLISSIIDQKADWSSYTKTVHLPLFSNHCRKIKGKIRSDKNSNFLIFKKVLSGEQNGPGHNQPQVVPR